MCSELPLRTLQSKTNYYSTALIVFRIITVIDTFFRLRRYVFSANRRSSNHLIDAPNGRIDQMTPWHFFRFLAARYALPPKIEKNALKKIYEKNAPAWPTARAADGLGVGKY